VAKPLRAAGFEVKANPKIARPRQTDLSARGDGIELLIEVKNQQRRADIGIVDSLRARLKSNTHIVGVILAGHRGHEAPDGRRGLTVVTPTKSFSLSVAIVHPWASAMAAIIVSRALRGRP
jgi:hypothetical protein